jgi:hypothetical protein
MTQPRHHQPALNSLRINTLANFSAATAPAPAAPNPQLVAKLFLSPLPSSAYEIAKVPIYNILRSGQFGIPDALPSTSAPRVSPASPTPLLFIRALFGSNDHRPPARTSALSLSRLRS